MRKKIILAIIILVFISLIIVSTYSSSAEIVDGIAIKEDGQIVYSGDFVGKSSIAEVLNIQDMDFNGSSIIYLKEDGTVDYNSNDNFQYYIESLKWEDVIDVAIGKDFLAGLKKDGSVAVASENPFLKEAEKLKDIKAIDAANNYFIAYDGTNIYGFGENKYNQFISSPELSNVLSVVSNVQVNCSKDSIVLSFNPVDNAKGYEVKLNDYIKEYPNNININLDASSLINGEKYTIIIKAIAEEYYVDSAELEYEFVYEYEDEPEPEIKEETITITNDLLSMSKDEFEAYLNSINVSSQSSESEEVCASDKITISDIEGIVVGQTYKKSELQQLLVKYRYCKIELGE